MNIFRGPLTSLALMIVYKWKNEIKILRFVFKFFQFFPRLAILALDLPYAFLPYAFLSHVISWLIQKIDYNYKGYYNLKIFEINCVF